jgi:hypothetical protein
MQFALPGFSVCKNHGANWPSVKEGRYSGSIKSKELKESYLKFLNDPNICDFGDELSLMRCCLQAVVQKCKGSFEKASGETLGLVMQLTDQVARATAQLNAMEKRMRDYVHISRLRAFLAMVLDELAKHTDQETLDKVAAGFDGIRLPITEQEQITVVLQTESKLQGQLDKMLEDPALQEQAITLGEQLAKPGNPTS